MNLQSVLKTIYDPIFFKLLFDKLTREPQEQTHYRMMN